VSRANPSVLWSGGETMIFMGFTVRSLNGGATWDWVWDSRQSGDNQTADVVANPFSDGLALTGHEGYVLRTTDNGSTFAQVLAAPSRFFLDWDGGNPRCAYAAGSPNGGTAHAFLSCDLGQSWTDITGALAPRTVLRVAADATRAGVVYAATDSGVYRRYGGGSPVCLDARSGLDALALRPGACPPGAPGSATLVGDAIAVDPANFVASGTGVSLGEAECLVNDGDVALVTLDTPDPAAGRALAVLARAQGADHYGASSAGLPRRPLRGDCTP
jgi:hypothetical protein